MDAQARQLLLQIGTQLDAQIFPRVKNGGFVMPGEASRSPKILGVEKKDVERERQGGTWQPGQPGAWRGEPWARTWQSRQPRPAGRPGPAGKTPPVVGAATRAAYEQEISALENVYPGVQVWKREGCVWLLVESRVLPGLRQHALFLVGLSYIRATVRSWAFWEDQFTPPCWIGPRHTNYPDGSICAFEPADGTWYFGDPLVELLDLYTVWSFRHLHFKTIGKWPGSQAVHLPYERLIEIHPDELCGCGNKTAKYAECCRPIDAARDRIRDALDFILWTGWKLRAPPQAVVHFATTKKQVELLDALIHPPT